MSAPPPSTISELLTTQFYEWELRGRGWQLADATIEIEPPFRPFTGHVLPRHLFPDDGIEETSLSRFAEKILGFLGKPPEPPPRADASEIEEPDPRYVERRADLIELQVELPKSYAPSKEVMAQ